MKITDLELFTVRPRWLFLKISTDEGYFGWGEPIVEGQAGTVRGAVEDMADYLLGRDPLQIEDIWQSLFRGRFYRGGPVMMSAIAGVNQALWDIKGQVSRRASLRVTWGESERSCADLRWCPR